MNTTVAADFSVLQRAILTQFERMPKNALFRVNVSGDELWDCKSFIRAVVKQIIDIKLAEREASKAAKEKAEKKQKILAILERKQDAALENASAEELQSLLATL